MMVDFLPARRERWVKSSSDPSLSKEIYPSSSAITRSYFSKIDSSLIKVLSERDSFNRFTSKGTVANMTLYPAIQALMKGYKVLFTPVSEMLHNLNASKADNTYYQKVDYYLKPDLLILDELGLKGCSDTVLMTSLKSSPKDMKKAR